MAIAFVTMVYNDAFFLDLWLRYHEKFVPRSDIHIICHGPQPEAERMAEGCNIVICERDPTNAQMDRDRFIFVSDYCTSLVPHYDRVIYNDVDEVIVLDPDHGDDPVKYIAGIDPAIRVISPLGLEIIHRVDLESDYDYSRPMFAQRRFVRMSGHYTKPNITNVGIIWRPDGHGASHDTLYLDDHLYTFHLKWFDQQFHVNRYRDRTRMHITDDKGRVHKVGAGSWIWSEAVYKAAANRFLAMPIVPVEENFVFTDRRAQVLSTFGTNGGGQYKIGWFTDVKLHTLPERFVGLI